MNYAVVINGEDMITEGSEVVTDVAKRSAQDSTVRGWKKRMKEDSVATEELVDRIIRNTYRTLMTRGSRGCYVYCVNQALTEHLSTLS